MVVLFLPWPQAGWEDLLSSIGLLRTLPLQLATSLVQYVLEHRDDWIHVSVQIVTGRCG